MSDDDDAIFYSCNVKCLGKTCYVLIVQCALVQRT